MPYEEFKKKLEGENYTEEEMSYLYNTLTELSKTLSERLLTNQEQDI